MLRRVNNYNGKFVGVMELVIDEAQINRMYRNFESEDMEFFSGGCRWTHRIIQR